MSEYRIEIPAAECIASRSELVTFRLGPFYGDYWQRLRQRATEHGVDRYRLIIDMPYRKRSAGPRSQNNHLHGHCQQIALYHGNSVDDIKQWIKRKAADERGYPSIVMPDGSTQPKSSAEASVEECSILIECAHQVAAEECDGMVLIEGDEHDT